MPRSLADLAQLRCFLVVGDPLCATTHTDLWLRARPGMASCGKRSDSRLRAVRGGSVTFQYGSSTTPPSGPEHRQLLVQTAARAVL